MEIDGQRHVPQQTRPAGNLGRLREIWGGFRHAPFLPFLIISGLMLLTLTRDGPLKFQASQGTHMWPKFYLCSTFRPSRVLPRSSELSWVWRRTARSDLWTCAITRSPARNTPPYVASISCNSSSRNRDGGEIGGGDSFSGSNGKESPKLWVQMPTC